jgi:guanine deaminase
VVVWDWAAGTVARHRDAMARGALPGVPAQALHARVFAWLTLGDERNVVATYVAGAQQGVIRDNPQVNNAP